MAPCPQRLPAVRSNLGFHTGLQGARAGLSVGLQHSQISHHRRHTPPVLSFQSSGDTGCWTQTFKQHLCKVTTDTEGECSGEKGG